MSDHSAEPETDDHLDDHIIKREVIEAFNHLGTEWNKAFEVLHVKINDPARRLTSVDGLAPTSPNDPKANTLSTGVNDNAPQGDAPNGTDHVSHG